jgi:hypothetical protein
MILVAFQQVTIVQKVCPTSQNFLLPFLFKFFPKIFIAYLLVERYEGNHWTTQLKREQRRTTEQADEKVVEHVDRMTTKRSHNYPKIIANVRFVTVIYVLHN